MALMILSFTPASFNRIRSWVSVLKLVAEVAILLRMISSESLAFCIWTMSSLVSTVPGPELRSADKLPHHLKPLIDGQERLIDHRLLAVHLLTDQRPAG